MVGEIDRVRGEWEEEKRWSKLANSNQASAEASNLLARFLQATTPRHMIVRSIIRSATAPSNHSTSHQVLRVHFSDFVEMINLLTTLCNWQSFERQMVPNPISYISESSTSKPFPKKQPHSYPFLRTRESIDPFSSLRLHHVYSTRFSY